MMSMWMLLSTTQLRSAVEPMISYTVQTHKSKPHTHPYIFMQAPILPKMMPFSVEETLMLAYMHINNMYSTASIVQRYTTN